MAIRINYGKAGIEIIQQNSRCRLCGDREKTVNHIISECSKFANRLDTRAGSDDTSGIVQEV